ncbi:receptor expression-enhancing protein 1-like isoform X2 [Stegodyphus dumicola]|uniref:receptor expression-enhancing protein 1-like isoform X2 n=1 Tax=Stegodyphus dumicola TaxID=202533 RepID=UPI0015AF07C6|nr:receptor expression-enhancing protein 1-like isoform X2 [Stegodyphus dumicola]
MASAVVSRLVILIFGTLYPAYASYKAVKTKNVKEYVKWMMYWIIFALFTCVETFADILVSFWLPFYYEMKILFVLWLLSPATRGSSLLYRRFVHPQLTKHEKEIDEYISKARDQGYNTVLQLGSKGLSYATAVVMQTALKGQETLVQHLRKSYSMSDLIEDPASSSQRFSTSPSAAANMIDETDSGSDENHKPLRHRWVSEGVLSEDEKLSKGRGQPVRYLDMQLCHELASLKLEGNRYDMLLVYVYVYTYVIFMSPFCLIV